MQPEDCKNCEKEKVIHIKQIIDGKLIKADLCSDCPHAKQVEKNWSLTDEMQLLGAGKTLEQSSESEVCPNCGFSVQDFKKVGRLGCPQCYDAFFHGLETILKETQKGSEHKGKVPGRMVEEEQLLGMIAELEEKMNKAVASEEYETAAEMRDQLRDYQNRLDGLKARKEQEASTKSEDNPDS